MFQNVPMTPVTSICAATRARPPSSTSPPTPAAAPKRITPCYKSHFPRAGTNASHPSSLSLHNNLELRQKKPLQHLERFTGGALNAFHLINVLFVLPGGVAGAAGSAPRPAVGLGPATGSGARLPGCGPGLLRGPCAGCSPRLSHGG